MGEVRSYAVLAIMAFFGVVTSLAINRHTAVIGVLLVECALLGSQGPSVICLRALESEVLDVADYIHDRAIHTGQYPEDLSEYALRLKWARSQIEIEVPDIVDASAPDDFWVYYWLPGERRTISREYSPREGWRFVDD